MSLAKAIRSPRAVGILDTLGIQARRLRLRRPDALYLHITAILVAIAGIGVAHYITPLSYQHWHNALQHVYFFPVVYAGLTFGWRGGLGAALFTGIVQSAHVWETWSIMPAYAVDQILDIPIVCAAGVLTGVLVERERRQRAQLARTTQQLNEVYQQLQRNFDQMKRAERLYAVGQLSAGLAHEIRNPLASITGACGILQRNAHLEERHQKVLGVIDKECQRLTRLLSGFLDFARPRTPRYQQVHAGVLLNSVLDLAAHAIGHKPVRLRREIEADLPMIECDPEQLKQLMLNLIINGIQAMPEGGDLVLSAVARNGKIRFRIIDEGCGIMPENRERIFDPFFTTKEGGTGLGLSVAHQIVEQHGGVLTAESNPVKGMTFTVVLPARRESQS